MVGRSLFRRDSGKRVCCQGEMGGVGCRQGNLMPSAKRPRSGWSSSIKLVACGSVRQKGRVVRRDAEPCPRDAGAIQTAAIHERSLRDIWGRDTGPTGEGAPACATKADETRESVPYRMPRQFVVRPDRVMHPRTG